MPDKITLDDALTTSQGQQRITLDEAMSATLSQARPILREGRREGGPFELIPDPTTGQLLAAPVRGPENLNFWASTKSAIPADPATQMRVLARSLFPDDPNAEQRVGVFNGVPVYVDDAGQLRRVSGQLTNLLSKVAANTPEIAGTIVGSMVTANPVSGGALGGAAGRGLKRGFSQLVFDEPATPLSVAQEMGAEAALNFMTGGTGKLGVKGLNRQKIIDFSPANIKQAEQAREYVKRTTGIDLDLAQASGDAKLIALRNYAARYPGKSAEVIQAANEAALGQFDQATKRVLDLVSQSGPSEFLGQRGVNAATLAIKAAREKVYNQVRPLYDAAYAAVPEVKDQAILDMMKLPHFEAAYKSGQRIAKLEGQAVAEGAVPSLRALDYTKRALDDKIESLIDAGKRQEARALTMRRNDFVAAIDAIPNQQWQQARQQYAQLIERDVMPLENGAVGVLAKVKYSKNATAAAKVLSDPAMTPDQIAMVKDVLSRQEPEAYRGLVRQWLGQQYNRALKETQAGATVNPAGKFRQAVYGTPDARERAKAMLPADAADAFDDLMVAAQKLSSTPIGGSDTARNLQITEQLKGRALAALSWIISPRQAARTAAEQRALDKGIESLTEALVDPGKRKQLRQITRMSDSTQQAIQLSTLLSGQVGAVATSVALDDETSLPAATNAPQAR